MTPASRISAMRNHALMKPKTGSSALRRGRRSISGQVYLITLVCEHRQRHFESTESARAVARLSQATCSWGDAQCLAWVVMPDHWHGLVELRDEPLSKVVSRFKACVTRHIGAVWQASYHGRALRSDANLRDAARYLVANPVRAGLVETVDEYPYWNAIWPTLWE